MAYRWYVGVRRASDGVRNPSSAMNKADIATVDIGSLLAFYRKAAIEHGAATETGDYRMANRRHDLISSVYSELRRRGGEAQRELLPLLDDIDEHVRAWAAAHALEFAPDRGEPVLKKLAAKTGLVGLNAQMTLEQWSTSKRPVAWNR